MEVPVITYKSNYTSRASVSVW